MTTAGRRGIVLLITAGMWACGKPATPPSPSPGLVSPSPVPATYSLSGRVFDRGTSVGLAGATVSIVDGPNAGKATTTDSLGHYSFAELQPSGLFNVTATVANYVPQTVSGTLTSNQTVMIGLRPQPAAVTLTGRVTDAETGRPIAGAVVYINGRYRGTADSAGDYVVSGLLDYGADFTMTLAENYVADYRYIRGRTVLDVRLYPIKRILAGQAEVVTVTPDDTLCVNNMQDTPGLGPDYVCRSLFVVAPTAGSVTIEAVSTRDGSHRRRVVDYIGLTQCCCELFGNQSTLRVAAGT
jgi:hypothetical protein